MSYPDFRNRDTLPGELRKNAQDTQVHYINKITAATFPPSRLMTLANRSKVASRVADSSNKSMQERVTPAQRSAVNSPTFYSDNQLLRS